MGHAVNRRTFLRATGAAAGAGLFGAGYHVAGAADAGKGAPHAEKLGWRLGCQAYTFRAGSFFEAIDKTAELGLHYIEAYPGQRLKPGAAADAGKAKDESKPKEKGRGRGNPPDSMGTGLSADLRKETLKRLADKGVKLVNFGVGPANKAAFDFAKDMGIETLVSEPAFNAFDDLDKLVEEYQINIAIHDHPKPSPYWDPEIVLEHTKGRSKRIGACCDTGHWMRSDIKPVDAIKKLEGRIISFHFKDLNEFGRGAHDVPWGTGRGDVKGMLTEVKRQGVKAVFSIEYENRTFAMSELAECVAYFDKVAAELGG